jgi:hypothetical protein
MQSASRLECEAAVMIQNGVVGTLLRSSNSWICSGAEWPPESAATTTSATNDSTLADRVWKNEGVGSGNAAGWAWWVRVTFASPLDKDSSEMSRDAGQREYYWDLLFPTIEGANEFLEYVRDVRGFKAEEELYSSHDEEIEGDMGADAIAHGDVGSGVSHDRESDDEEGDGGRCSYRKIFGVRRHDGVVLFIGDD